MIKKVKGKKKPLILAQVIFKRDDCMCPCHCDSPGCGGSPFTSAVATAGSAISAFWGI